VARYRWLHWLFARLCVVLDPFMALFYTAIVLRSLFTNTLWLYLHPWGTFLILLPVRESVETQAFYSISYTFASRQQTMFLRSYVPALADRTVEPRKYLASNASFFIYAPTRMQGTN